jgi:hypothetical protein
MRRIAATPPMTPPIIGPLLEALVASAEGVESPFEASEVGVVGDPELVTEPPKVLDLVAWTEATEADETEAREEEDASAAEELEAATAKDFAAAGSKLFCFYT